MSLTPFGLSLSKPCSSFLKKSAAPFDAACGVAQDRLRQAQGERLFFPREGA
ncbi:hypothetical protein M529_13475 [Sphingobium ummariense RL-3]|uniref:Uncharacterized protein n=1 Tax=Sphingobium ummariense RL-3 TaxID=1346791 RepID=T0IS41_9SPHN|nr:hypothetical protein M529_13475 [Sphingobium ummariense RL-3]